MTALKVLSDHTPACSLYLSPLGFVVLAPPIGSGTVLDTVVDEI
ncbi:MAG: hypothetical protein OEW13_03685 [Nitrospira sp.]|nr:hypothetical protein [Nitrospira sp.]